MGVESAKSTRSVHVQREVVEQILAHARAAAPLECCGLLLGTPERLDAALAARNLLASPTRFELDPVDHFAAIRRARGLGVAVVGVYHSHPASAPVPSFRDLAEASYPDFVYLIAGLPEADVRAYRLVEGNFHPVALVPFS
jgi:proteasome lid subunit RPN8/RPN11